MAVTNEWRPSYDILHATNDIHRNDGEPSLSNTANISSLIAVRSAYSSSNYDDASNRLIRISWPCSTTWRERRTAVISDNKHRPRDVICLQPLILSFVSRAPSAGGSAIMNESVNGTPLAYRWRNRDSECKNVGKELSLNRVQPIIVGDACTR